MNFISAVIIHVVVPISGGWLFRLLKTQMQLRQQLVLSNIELVLVLISYGGWVMVILTGYFWYWSGLATLGLAYLLFIAPFVMLYLAWRLFHQRTQSRLHTGYFVVCTGYILLPLSALLMQAKLIR